MKDPKRTCSAQHGVALLELALLLPFLAALIFGGFEFARALRVGKMVTTLSRSVANQTLRDCSPVWEDPQRCLDEVRARAEQFAAPGMGNVQVIVSIYRENPASGVLELAGMSPAEADQAAPRVTKFCRPGQSCQHPLDTALLRAAGMVVVGEVYADFEPIVEAVPPIFWFSPESLYEATIF